MRLSRSLLLATAVAALAASLVAECGAGAAAITRRGSTGAFVLTWHGRLLGARRARASTDVFACTADGSCVVVSRKPSED
jgi:hypothetical protein